MRSASATMVRNLYIQNTRPWKPARRCRKTIGPARAQLDGDADRRRTAATGARSSAGRAEQVGGPLGEERALARERRREPVERQAEDLLDEGMGVGRADTGPRAPACRRRGSRTSRGASAMASSSCGRPPRRRPRRRPARPGAARAAPARDPSTGTPATRPSVLGRAHGQAAAHDPARLGIARQRRDEAAAALPGPDDERDARPALAAQPRLHRAPRQRQAPARPGP